MSDIQEQADDYICLQQREKIEASRQECSREFRVKPDTQKKILPGEHSVPWRANKCEGGETDQTNGT